MYHAIKTAKRPEMLCGVKCNVMEFLNGSMDILEKAPS